MEISMQQFGAVAGYFRDKGFTADDEIRVGNTIALVLGRNMEIDVDEAIEIVKTGIEKPNGSKLTAALRNGKRSLLVWNPKDPENPSVSVRLLMEVDGVVSENFTSIPGRDYLLENIFGQVRQVNPGEIKTVLGEQVLQNVLAL